MAPSPHRLLALAAVAAAGFVALRAAPSGGSPPAAGDDGGRRLRNRHHHPFSDPRTVELRTDAPAVTADAPPAYSADPSPLDWADVDPHLYFKCGRIKCFFESRSDPSRGYLMWVHSHVDPRAVREHDWALEIESAFGIRHFMLGPPYLAAMPEEFVAHFHSGHMRKEHEHLSGPRSVIVQDSLTAPEGSKTFKCNVDRERTTTLDYIIANGSEGWQQTLLGELAHTKTLLESDLGRGLAIHFQFMIDLEGRIYHVDFDRAIDQYGMVMPVADSLVLSEQACLEESMEYIRNSMD